MGAEYDTFFEVGENPSLFFILDSIRKADKYEDRLLATREALFKIMSSPTVTPQRKRVNNMQIFKNTKTLEMLRTKQRSLRDERHNCGGLLYTCDNRHYVFQGNRTVRICSE